MKHVVVFSHPNPRSFNRAILDSYVGALEHGGHEVRVRDLYGLGFQPVLSATDLVGAASGRVAEDVRVEQEHVAWADVVTFIYPLWWAGMPAVAKGYLDRVFSEGFAYAFDETGLRKLLASKGAVTITTLGDTSENYRRLGFFDAMNRLMDGILFDFAGLKPLEHKYFGSVVLTTDDERRRMLEEVVDLARRIGPTAELDDSAHGAESARGNRL
jgi:NAD(P)H dehydrogenase (quinone)